LAVDGLHFLELLNLAPFTPEEREQVLAKLVESAEKL
jgi:hypothetical protein